jgi:hypothetical protein
MPEWQPVTAAAFLGLMLWYIAWVAYRDSVMTAFIVALFVGTWATMLPSASAGVVVGIVIWAVQCVLICRAVRAWNDIKFSAVGYVPYIAWFQTQDIVKKWQRDLPKDQQQPLTESEKKYPCSDMLVRMLKKTVRCTVLFHVPAVL